MTYCRKVKSEDTPKYAVNDVLAGENEILAKALAILDSRCKKRDVLLDPSTVREYLRMAIGALPYEVFGCLFLDSQNGVIERVDLFRGTVSQVSVYPREVVKEAMKHNAVGVICYHNHPGGDATPSMADKLLTSSLKHAFALMDIKLLDHVILTESSEYVSFTERGLL